jgi:hypothetical protein
MSRRKQKKSAAIAIFAKLAVILLLLCMLILPSPPHQKFTFNFYLLKPLFVSLVKQYSGAK